MAAVCSMIDVFIDNYQIAPYNNFLAEFTALALSIL